MNKTLITVPLITLIIGGVVGYFLHPKTEIITPDVTKYEYENKIQALEYKAKLSEIETQYLQRLHFIENADSSQLDSLWINYGF